MKAGFAGPIHATPATVDLCGVMLPDSAHIQEIEVEQFNRRAARRDRGSVTPIYTGADATACLDLFRSHPYDSWFAVLPGLRARAARSRDIRSANLTELFTTALTGWRNGRRRPSARATR